jgi:predicted YcjX-like family ATPase
MTPETTTIESIEVTENKIVQVKEKHSTFLDGVEIITYHRTTIAPGEDYSNQLEEVQKICAESHSDKVIENYKNHLTKFSILNQMIGN